MHDPSVSADAHGAYLLHGLIEAMAPVRETPEEARTRTLAIAALYRDFAPATAVESMIACQCIGMRFAWLGAMRALSAQEEGDAKARGRAEAAVNALSKTMHLWFARYARLKAEARAAAKAATGASGPGANGPGANGSGRRKRAEPQHPEPAGPPVAATEAATEAGGRNAPPSGPSPSSPLPSSPSPSSPPSSSPSAVPAAPVPGAAPSPGGAFRTTMLASTGLRPAARHPEPPAPTADSLLSRSRVDAAVSSLVLSMTPPTIATPA